uniref:Amino acid transporter transmembrane domain-containing protein n=1 Tax=Anopheles stephensi TaxID=30069 RepID=A0A182YF88_ANOST
MAIETTSSKDTLAELGAEDETLEDYDPYKHRTISKPNSTFGTFVHVMKGAMGVGILSMPYAIRNGGLIFGVIGTFLLGMLYSHCVHLLVDTAYKICKRERIPMLSFAQTVDRACALGSPRMRPMGKILKNVVDYFLMIPISSMIYMVFVGSTIHDVINARTDLDWDVRIYILLVAVPAIGITQVREIKYLVPFSAIATTLIFANVVISLYYIFKEPLSFDDRDLFPSFDSLTNFLGFIGVVGYLRYGDKIQGSITLNFPQEEDLAMVIQILSAVAILFSIGIFFYVPIETVWRRVHERVPPKWHVAVQTLIRLAYLLGIVAIACAVPDIGTFVGFIGAVFNPILALWFPIIVDSIYRWPGDFGWMKWRLVKNGLMALFGLYLLITGTISSVEDIIDLYK